MVQMAFCDLSYTFHKQVTNVSQHVFVILQWGILTSSLRHIIYQDTSITTKPITPPPPTSRITPAYLYTDYLHIMLITLGSITVFHSISQTGYQSFPACFCHPTVGNFDVSPNISMLGFRRGGEAVHLKASSSMVPCWISPFPLSTYPGTHCCPKLQVRPPFKLSSSNSLKLLPT